MGPMEAFFVGTMIGVWLGPSGSHAPVEEARWLR